jgi:hypothetical protein
MAVLPLATTEYPVAPLSDEPTESVSTRSGRCSRNWSFTLGENTAAVLDSANSEDRS